MRRIITKIYEQYVQIIAVIIVAIKPIVNPAQPNAYGIDNIPDPRDAFNRCIVVSQSLKKNKHKIIKLRIIRYFNLKI